MKNNTLHCRLLSTSKISVAYNVFLIVTLTVLNVLFIARFYETGYVGSDKFDRLMGSIEDFLDLLSVISILTTYTLLRKNILAMANKIKAAEKWFIIFDSNDEHTNEKQHRTTIILLLMVQWLIFTLKFATITNQREYILFCASKYFSDLISKNTFTQYVVMLKLIKKSFERVNEKLSRILRDLSTRKTDVLHHQQNNVEPTVQKLNVLHKNHLLLCEISKDVSDFYAYSMFISLIDIFIALVVLVYLLAKTIVLGVINMSAMDYIHVIVCWFNCVVALLSLTTSVGATVSESKSTSGIINSCLVNTNDEEIIKKLNQFSNYLLHVDLKFTVFHLYRLDQSILLSISGSITTYLVILFQFQDDN
ncbi:putative gustatory receptor 28b [Copidosoma floridanum]|uniref:putative gustatory receptor 28b n=1 Tax=Copidosoma floridanum TaxID=29053 RepID=UPI000C6FACC9|nr:putative gustatory receptor 28b [Copidosoma floridanum]